VDETAVATPEEYIEALDEPRRSEVRRLDELIRSEAPELEPHIAYRQIGYGKYRFRYKTGREGDWATIGLGSRKSYISLYINAVGGERDHYLAEEYRDLLPKADIGRSCVRIKKLADVDEATLRQLVREAAKQAGDYIET